MFNCVFKTKLHLSLLACMLMLCAPYAHAVTESLGYDYDDDRQVRETNYEDGTTIDYSYDTSGNRLAKDTDTSPGTNNSPSAPSNPDPSDTESDVPLPITLSWTASTDPDAGQGDVVTYDIYLGTNASPSLIASGYQSTTYPVVLKPNVTYYWKVVARDNHNATATNGVWSFTTQNVPVEVPVASFSVYPNDVIGPINVYFTNNSTGYPPLTYKWDFDNDGNVDSTEKDPIHLYDAGTHTAKLTVDDHYGGSSYTTHEIRILLDSDSDGIEDSEDNCPDDYNPDQTDTNSDGEGDACDTDIDGDGVPNSTDNCIYIQNALQEDYSDGIGNLCDADIDEDGVMNYEDNCPFTANADQADSDSDNYGDACTVVTCVSNSADLQTALADAQTNNKNDIINLAAVTYSVADNDNAKFSFISTEYFSLILRGGYDSGCNERIVEPGNTIIDGTTSQETRINTVFEIINANATEYDKWLKVAPHLLEIDGITVEKGQKGVYVSSRTGDITVKDSIFEDNYNTQLQGSIWVSSDEGVVRFHNNKIRDNVNGSKSAYLRTTTGKIEMVNNLITGNKAYASAAGAYVGVNGEKGEAYIVNNTITENLALQEAGGLLLYIYKESGLIELHNNIIWNNDGNPYNGGNDLFKANVTGTVVAYNNDFNDTYINFDDQGDNINADPSFLLPGSWEGEIWIKGDYRLRPGSPCLDTGNYLGATFVDIDLSGNPRMLYDVVDMGAYEASGINILPDFGDYEYVNVNSPSSKTFKVINNGQADVLINSVANPSVPFNIVSDLCKGQTITPEQGSECTIEIEFLPTNNILYLGSFGILSDDVVNSILTVNLRGIGNYPPVADPGGPYTGTEGQPITLDGSGSTDTEGPIALYEWDIDDDGTYEYSTALSTQEHTYLNNGLYTIRLRVTDSNDATHEDTTSANISDTEPTANFTSSPTSDWAPLTVNFTNTSTGYDEPLSYEWDFDNDGTVDSTETNPSHEYTAPGIYTVKLTAIDSDGSPNEMTRTNYITVYVELYVSKEGVGTGTVTSYPQGIDCGSDCAEVYTDSVTVTLTATPENGDYVFSGWSGEGCSGTGECIVTMDNHRHVIASFGLCPNDPVRIPGSPATYFSTLQAAYDAASNGDTIQSRYSIFVEDLIYNNSSSTILEGGYNCEFSLITGTTTVQEQLTIQNGQVTIYDYHIEEGAGSAQASSDMTQPEVFGFDLYLPLNPTSTPAMIE